MNWAKGLKRLSAVFWGLCTIFFSLYAAAVTDYTVGDLIFIGIGFICFYALYLVTCWVINVTCWVINGFAPKD